MRTTRQSRRMKERQKAITQTKRKRCSKCQCQWDWLIVYILVNSRRILSTVLCLVSGTRKITKMVARIKTHEKGTKAQQPSSCERGCQIKPTIKVKIQLVAELRPAAAARSVAGKISEGKKSKNKGES